MSENDVKVIVNGVVKSASDVPVARKVVMQCPHCNVSWVAEQKGTLRQNTFGPLNCQNHKCTGEGFYREGIIIAELPPDKPETREGSV